MFKTLFLLLAFQTSVPSDSIPLIDSNKILEEVEQLIESEKFSDAVSRLEKVSPYDSNYLIVQEKLISTLASAGQLEQALQLGESIIGARTDLPVLMYITLGNLYLNNERVTEGMTVYQSGLQFYPFDETLLYNLGYGNYLLDDYDEAIQYLQMALSVRPFYRSAHSVLANIMALYGYRTRAALSYLTYLMIDSDQNWALVRLNDLMNDAYRFEGSVESNMDNSIFAPYDNLLRSKAALDDRFQSAVDFEAPVVQQSELLISQLKYTPGTDDFWMNFYVPVFEKLRSEGLVEPFLYFTLYSTGNEKVNEYLEKNTKEKEAWVNVASETLRQTRRENKRSILGQEGVYTHWFFDSGALNAIGAESGPNNVGPYHFYHSNGRLSAIGEYNDQGNKIGTWKYYHENGQLRSEEKHNEAGEVEGEIVRRNDEGQVQEVGYYKDGKWDGLYKWYYPCGTLKEQYPYKAGVGTGMGEVYFPTGELQIKYGVRDSELDGDYIAYFKNGQVQRKYKNKKDEADGLYQSYYANGQLEQEGMYEMDKAQGVWTSYYNNGQLSDSGAFVDDHREGLWKYYNKNGLLKRTENYNQEGLRDGKMLWFDLDGKLYSERMYRGDTLIGYKYYDKKGNVLSEASNEQGTMPYEDYYPTGEQNIVTSLLYGDFHGSYKEYFVNGALYQEGVMDKGSWIGEYRKYDDRGKLSIETSYEEGVNSGYYRSYHSNGSLEREGWMIDGNQEQTWREYFPNGQIQVESFYDRGKLHGMVRYFDSKGRRYSVEQFDRDLFKSVTTYDSLGVVTNSLNARNGEPYEILSAAGEVRLSTTKLCGESVEGIVSYYPGGKEDFRYIMEKSYYKSYRGIAPDGLTQVKGDYIVDQVHGVWEYFDNDGQLQSTDPYLLGSNEGVETAYYEDGTVESTCEYYQGSRHGKCEYYDPSGDLQIIKHYKYDFGVTGYQYLLKDGTLSDVIAIDPQKTVEVKAYYETGELSVSQVYNKHNLDGKSEFFFKNGKPALSSIFGNGKRLHRTEYFENGQVKRESRYENGQLHGEEKIYHRNGELKESANRSYGRMDGWNRFFAENGSLKYEFFYRNGQIY